MTTVFLVAGRFAAVVLTAGRFVAGRFVAGRCAPVFCFAAVFGAAALPARRAGVVEPLFCMIESPLVDLDPRRGGAL
ncbi:MAG: hypothetical protein ACXWUL_02435 [Caldimonas sp.]